MKLPEVRRDTLGQIVANIVQNSSSNPSSVTASAMLARPFEVGLLQNSFSGSYFGPSASFELYRGVKVFELCVLCACVVR